MRNAQREPVATADAGRPSVQALLAAVHTTAADVGCRSARPGGRGGYSHSIVPGGFDEMSSATRFTPGTSLMIREEMTSRRS